MADWRVQFASRISTAFARLDWPAIEESAWERVIEAMVRHRLAEHEAEAVFVVLEENPPYAFGFVVKFLVDAIRTVRQRQPEPVAMPTVSPYADQDAASERHWESLGADERDRWMGWAREHYPGLAENSRLGGVAGERLAKWLLATAQAAAWDTSEGREPKIPKAIKPWQAPEDRKPFLIPEKVEPPPDRYRQADEARAKIRAAMRAKGGAA